MDGASGWPLPERRGKTCLELARTPNLNTLSREGMVGLARTVPPGMEPSSACACMSILGYNPEHYYSGRAAIESESMGISLEEGDAAFRCNLVAIRDGKMWSYSTGQIRSDESHALISTLQDKLGNESLHFYPGVGYRHICVMKGRQDTLQATCTPPHDIPDKPIKEFIPHGPGSDFLRELMTQSEEVLRDHPINMERRSRGDIPATMIWLFWGSRKANTLPKFREVYGIDAAMTSAVDLLQGLAKMAGIERLDIPGVTAGLDNDCAAQITGALDALSDYDLVVVHIEAPDEAGHDGSIEDKTAAIQRIDRDVIPQLLSWQGDKLRLLIMPDHPTPIAVKTHVPDPVPFVLWGSGFKSNGAKAFSEREAGQTGVFIQEGHSLAGMLIRGQ